MKYIFKAIGYYLTQGLLVLLSVGVLFLFSWGMGKFIDHVGLKVMLRWTILIVFGVGFLLWFVIAVLEKVEELVKEEQVKNKNN